MRAYSLISSPHDTSSYAFAVLESDESRGGSRFVHRTLAPGALLDVNPPRGSFRLVASATRTTLIAGGIGITPIYAFAEALRARGADYQLHYSARTRDRMAFADALLESHGEHTRLYFDRAGRTSLDLAAAIGAPAIGHHIYTCGPRTLIEGVKRLAGELGWRADHIHFETFGPASATTRSTPVSLRLSQSDLTVQVPPNVTLLEAMEEAGAFLDSECRRGECGKCTVSYSAGEVEHLDVCLSDEARQTQLCPCVSRALSDQLTVDA